ncbi:MAG TPA: hypothetical protein VMS71_04730, partial [Candidatus Acidoferrum sp.]|nr:hypothetical protein [Candidatus Acidoferrum sp.]
QSYMSPKVAMRANGDFVIMNRNISGSAILSFYSSDGQALLTNLQISNRGSQGGSVSDFDVCMNDSGHILVAWSTGWEGANQNRGQYLDFSGAFLGSEFDLCPTSETSKESRPRVLIDNSDRVTVLSSGNYDDLTGGFKTLRRRLMAFGAVPTETRDTLFIGEGQIGYGTSSSLRLADVALDSDGTLAVACYLNYNNSHFESDGALHTVDAWCKAVLRTYGSDGVPLGDPTSIPPDSTGDFHWPRIAMSVAPGGFEVSVQPALDTTLLIQNYSTAGVAEGSPRVLYPRLHDQQMQILAQARSANGTIYVWQSAGLADSLHLWGADPGDIRTQLYLDGASMPLADRRVNDDYGTNQLSPRVFTNSSGNSLAVWLDDRVPQGIYVQRYDALGRRVDAAIKINDSVGIENCGLNGYELPITVSQFEVASNGNDRLVIAWRYSGWCHGGVAFIQAFDGPNFTRYDRNMSVEPHWQGGATDLDVAVAADKSVVVAYRYDVSGYRDNMNLYARKYDAFMLLVGDRIQINDRFLMATDPLALAPHIAARPDGSFGVAWMELDSNTVPVALKPHFRIYNTNLEPVTPPIIIDANGPNITPDVAVNARGQYAVAWTSRENYSGAVYAVILDSLGTVLSLPAQVSANGGAPAPCVTQLPKIIDGPDDNFLAVFSDRLLGHYSIWARAFAPNGALVGNVIRIDNDGQSTAQLNPSVSRSGNQLAISWEDGRDRNFTSDAFARWLEWSDVSAGVGDLDGSGVIDISDLTYFVDYLFAGGPAPAVARADMDANGVVDIGDLVALLDYLFAA